MASFKQFKLSDGTKVSRYPSWGGEIRSFVDGSVRYVAPSPIHADGGPVTSRVARQLGLSGRRQMQLRQGRTNAFYVVNKVGNSRQQLRFSYDAANRSLVVEDNS